MTAERVEQQSSISTMPEWLVILICGGTFFSVVVMNYVLSPLLPRIASDFTISKSEAGVLVTVYGLLFAVSALFLGSFSARFGRKRVMIVTLTAFALMTFCTGLAPTFKSMLLFRALSGLAASVVQTATWSTVASSIPYGRRGRATGWVMQAGTLALLGGVPLGGFLAQAVSWRAFFFLVAGLGLIFAFILSMRLPQDSPVPSGSSLTDSTFAGLRQLIARPEGRYYYSLSFLTWVAMFGFYTYLGSFLTERFDLNSAEVSQITLVLGIGYAIGGPAGGRLSDRIGRAPVIMTGLLLMMTVFVLLPAVAGTTAAIVLIALLGFGFFFTYSSQVTAISELMPESRGIGMATNYFVTYVGSAIGAAIGGQILIHHPYAVVGVASTGAAAVAALLAGRAIVMRSRQALQKPAQ